MLSFQKILIRQTDNGYESVAGIKLKSILIGDLILNLSTIQGDKNNLSNPLNPEAQHYSREAFLHVFCLKWNWSFPNLLYQSHSRLFTISFLRAFEDSEENVKEDIISRYIALMPLLSAHFSEMRFSPIINFAELNQNTYLLTDLMP